MTDERRRATKPVAAVKDREPANPDGALPPEPPYGAPARQVERRGWFHYVVYISCVVVATMVAMLMTDAFERLLARDD